MVNSEPRRDGILRVLDAGTLTTPAFQRSFAWEQAHIDEYWTDLQRALDTPGESADYFLGLVVLDHSNQIQDGQQRLATTLLLASEMYEFIERAKATAPHDGRLAKDALAQVAAVLRASPSAPLVIGLKDQDILLNRAGIRSNSPESAKRLVAARSRLSTHLESDLQGRTTADSKLARLKQWGEFLRTKAYVVTLRVPPKDAHNIFETLNTRGVRLSNGDLVKSHLIARASSTTAAVDKWNHIISQLTNADGKYEDDLESFLLHYFGSRYSRTTNREFFSDYRRRVENEDSLVSLEALLQSAHLYRALIDPAGQAAFWSSVGAGTQQAVELLNGLGLKQLRYLLLAVLRDLGTDLNDTSRRKRMREAIVRISGWSVRGLVHAKTGGGEAERVYIGAAAEIREGRIRNVDGLRQWFLDYDMLVSNDSEFRKAFKAFPFDRATSHNRARAILYALEYQKINNKSALRPRDTLTIEHVLPLSPQPGQWTAIGADLRPVYTHKLGNLLLIDGPSRANALLANKDWPTKRRLIKSWGAQTPLTSEGLRRQQWTTAAIEARDEALAKLAAETWKI